jgi:hypothetical protein
MNCVRQLLTLLMLAFLLLLLQGQPAVLALDAVPIPLAHATHFPLTNKEARKLSRQSNSSIDR